MANPARPLEGTVDRWEGRAGADDVIRVAATIIDTGVAGDSPYAKYSRQGATIVPRCLFFINEVENPASVQAGQTVTVNPRRGGQDKQPWKSLDLAAITGQTVESAHLFDVHLGETLVPYATLEPLRALLPLRQGESAIPVDTNGVGGVRLGGLDRRMRDRWRTISRLWETNKAAANELSLLGRADYHRELSSQFEWQCDHGRRPVRVAYSSAGTPTAALLHDDNSIVENELFWITCRNAEEAQYLLAIINSDVLYGAVASLLPPRASSAPATCKNTSGSYPSPNSTPPSRCTWLSPRRGQWRRPGRQSSWSGCGRTAPS